MPEIPRAAVREAIVNAFCHRDWTNRSAIVIDVFTNTVRITNPGLFPEGNPLGSFMDGTAEPSSPRNPSLVAALYKAGVIESYGSGLRRICDLCNEAGVRFAYYQEYGCTSIVFERLGSKLEESTANGEQIADNLSRALGLFTDVLSLTSKDVAESLGIGLRQAQYFERT